MAFLNPLFLIPATTGPIFIILGFLISNFPPKKINSIIGYRTSSSMKSQEQWNFAQIYSAKEMIKFGSLLTLCSLIELVLEIKGGLGVAIGLGLMILMIALIIIRTEKAIQLKFKND